MIQEQASCETEYWEPEAGRSRKRKRTKGKAKATYLKVTNNWSQDESDEKIKLIRAQGGCPGTIRRRRSWQAAKSYGELQAGFDP